MIMTNIFVAASIKVPHLVILLERLHPHAQKLRQCSTCGLHHFIPDKPTGGLMLVVDYHKENSKRNLHAQLSSLPLRFES